MSGLDHIVEKNIKRTKLCPICSRHMNAYHKNNRSRFYCSRTCFDVSQRIRQTIVDPGVVLRLIDGDPPPLTSKGERVRATAYLTDAGYSLIQISHILHITDRSISRYRRQLKFKT